MRRVPGGQEQVRTAAPDGVGGQTTLDGLGLPAWCAARPAEAMREVAELTGLFASGRLRAAVYATLPLTEVVKAHQLLEDRSQLGGILLVP